MRWPWSRERRERISYSIAHELLRSITYKPGVSFGWKFVQADPMSREMLVLTLDASVDNADKPGERTVLHSQRLIPAEKVTAELLIDEVYELCRQFEMHELGEFFRVQGVKVFDPHRS